MAAWPDAVITHKAGAAGMEIADEDKGKYGSFRPTDETLAAWERTREIAEALLARIILLQCPASFTPTEEHVANMCAFFKRVDRGGLTFAWEPRGE